MSIYKKVFEAKKGEFYDEDHYEMTISEDAIGLKEDGSILFIFKKNVIPLEERKEYLKIMKCLGKTKTKNRGAGGGLIDIKKFPPQAVEFCNKKGNPLKNEKIFSCHFKYEDGSVAKRCQGNQVRCGVAGFFDETAGLPCRKVHWSAHNDKRHIQLEGICKTISNHFKDVAPEIWTYQKSKINEDFIFKDSVFSTLTVNYDFRTACHRDKGDLENSLSTLTILEELENNYEGFYTGLPEYKLMFDLRDGDTLIFDAHEFHSNTEYIVKSDKLGFNDLSNCNFAGRLAIVAYLRNGIDICSNQL
tara:strand:+ start:1734 stop:2642 length:909 start_codon:yes stop_codon:yes gene_type:complete